nr:MAG TPA: hypothetical protein [Caudoviricetes sp.]
MKDRPACLDHQWKQNESGKNRSRFFHSWFSCFRRNRRSLRTIRTIGTLSKSDLTILAITFMQFAAILACRKNSLRR